MSWLARLLQGGSAKQPPSSPAPLPNPQPVHPPLIGNFVNGFLVYCGLISAGLIALVASDRFADLAAHWQWLMFAAIAGAFLGGGLSLVGFCFAINYARGVERGATLDELDQDRLWSLRFTNMAIYTAMGATFMAGVALAFYLGVPAKPEPLPMPLHPNQPIIIQPVECKPHIIEVCGHLIEK